MGCPLPLFFTLLSFSAGTGGTKVPPVLTPRARRIRHGGYQNNKDNKIHMTIIKYKIIQIKQKPKNNTTH